MTFVARSAADAIAVIVISLFGLSMALKSPSIGSGLLVQIENVRPEEKS